MLGRYIAIGVNEPSKYPTNPELSEPSKPTHSIDSFMRMAKQRYGKKE